MGCQVTLISLIRLLHAIHRGQTASDCIGLKAATDFAQERSKVSGEICRVLRVRFVGEVVSQRRFSRLTLLQDSFKQCARLITFVPLDWSLQTIRTSLSA